MPKPMPRWDQLSAEEKLEFVEAISWPAWTLTMRAKEMYEKIRTKYFTGE